jgi:MFS superfamily sulfate permease-like transporter
VDEVVRRRATPGWGGGITLVSLTETIATATSFAARRGDEADPDQEMVGVGTSNIAAGFFQGFAVSVSGSRTAVADQSGARTQLTGLAGAGLAAVLLLFLNGLLADLPQTALAAAVITAALSLMDLGVLIPASARPSMRSAMRPGTALCRPMKGCRLHEHRP